MIGIEYFFDIIEANFFMGCFDLIGFFSIVIRVVYVELYRINRTIFY